MQKRGAREEAFSSPFGEAVKVFTLNQTCFLYGCTVNVTHYIFSGHCVY